MHGPVVGAIAGAALMFWFALHHRQRAHLASQKGNDPLEKAQLHSDCIPKPTPLEVGTNERYELSGELSGEPSCAVPPYELGPGGPEKQGLVTEARSELEDAESKPRDLASGGYSRRTNPE